MREALSDAIVGLMLDRKKFLDQVKSENTKFRPFGRYIAEFQRKILKHDNSTLSQPKPPSRDMQTRQAVAITKTLKVYKVNSMNAYFNRHNPHLQALLKFYIESASSIPVDENWYYFLVYMDHKLVAYATTFDEFQRVPKAPVTIS